MDASYADGFETSLSMREAVRGHMPEPTKIAEAIQAQLAECGISVTIDVLEPGAFLDDAAASRFPMRLILVIDVVAILSWGLINALYSIAFVSIWVYARIARSSVLAVRELDCVKAARATGAPRSALSLSPVSSLPNALTSLIV